MIRVPHMLGALFVALGGAVSVHALAQPVLSPAQIDAQYDSARKHCDAMSGDQKDVCLKQARADRTGAEADAKAGKEKAEADRDATRTKRNADYEVAMKKCDTLSGDAQDKCEADAKTRYGK